MSTSASALPSLLSVATDSPPGEPSGARVPRWGLIAAAWTLYGIAHAVLSRLTSGANVIPWRWLIPITIPGAWLWALLTPAIIWLTRRLGQKSVPLAAAIGVHAVAALLTSFAVLATRRALIQLVSPIDVWPLLPFYLYWLDVNVLTYAAVVAISRAIDLHRRYRERTVRAHLLEVELARAQLQFLELQLQPHFLFNCLNAISELAHEAPNAAERMLRQLHTLLRVSLDRAGQDEIPLGEELESLEPYIDIQRARFSEWLTVYQEIDPEARDALVPHLILQPLVENAIRHGLAVRSAPGTVVVRAKRDGRRLRLQVADNGVGILSPRASHRPGIGLRNAANRLTQLYAADHRFELRPAPGGGTIVDLDIPYRSRDELAKVPPPDWSATGEWSTLPAQRVWSMPVVALGAALGNRTDDDSPEQVAAGVLPESRWKGLQANELFAMAPAALPSSMMGARAVFEPAARTAEQRAGAVKIGRESPRLTRRSWLGVAAVWLALAAFWSEQVYAVSRQLKADLTVRWIITTQLSSAAVWALLTPVVLLVARRLRITRHNWPSRLVLHLVVAVGLAVVHVAAINATGLLGEGPLLSMESLNPLLGDIFIYSTFIAWSHGRDFYAWYREREIAASRLESAIARSRYQALCVQLRPQFLLGTIDLLTRLVHQDVPRAERLIARLADVLRLTLDAAAERETSLRREIELVRAYVDVHRQGIRPGTSLSLRVASETLGVRLPNRLLRTLIDDLLAGTPDPDREIEIVIECEPLPSGDGTRIRIRACTPGSDAVDAGRRPVWIDTVDTVSIAERDRRVSLFFPDATTAIVVLADHDVGEPATSMEPFMALSAQPA